jgi:hypothetical protein
MSIATLSPANPPVIHATSIDVTMTPDILPLARPRKNAGLYRRIVHWAAATRGGVLETAGPLAGMTWDQAAWILVQEEARRTCCVAGGAVLLAGGIPADPYQPGGALTVCGGVVMPGTDWAVPVAVAAGPLLGVTTEEASMLFAPNRDLDELVRLVPIFDTDQPLRRGDLSAGSYTAVAGGGYSRRLGATWATVNVPMGVSFAW